MDEQSTENAFNHWLQKRQMNGQYLAMGDEELLMAKDAYANAVSFTEQRLVADKELFKCETCLDYRYPCACERPKIKCHIS